MNKRIRKKQQRYDIKIKRRAAKQLHKLYMFFTIFNSYKNREDIPNKVIINWRSYITPRNYFKKQKQES